MRDFFQRHIIVWSLRDMQTSYIQRSLWYFEKNGGSLLTLDVKQFCGSIFLAEFINIELSENIQARLSAIQFFVVLFDAYTSSVSFHASSDIFLFGWTHRGTFADAYKPPNFTRFQKPLHALYVPTLVISQFVRRAARKLDMTAPPITTLKLATSSIFSSTDNPYPLKTSPSTCSLGDTLWSVSKCPHCYFSLDTYARFLSFSRTDASTATETVLIPNLEVAYVDRTVQYYSPLRFLGIWSLQKLLTLRMIFLLYVDIPVLHAKACFTICTVQCMVSENVVFISKSFEIVVVFFQKSDPGYADNTAMNSCAYRTIIHKYSACTARHQIDFLSPHLVAQNLLSCGTLRAYANWPPRFYGAIVCLKLHVALPQVGHIYPSFDS